MIQLTESSYIFSVWTSWTRLMKFLRRGLVYVEKVATSRSMNL